MGTKAVAEPVQRELNRALDDARRCIERVEMVAVMLQAFNAPIPEYEPRLRNLPFNLKSFELGRANKNRS
ncbi:MAG TPA: hypothetical protein VFX37_07655 [Pseudolabrys sp.]|nr:hypothetical protein [Pseudolabrys sp.]